MPFTKEQKLEHYHSNLKTAIQYLQKFEGK